MGRKRGNGEGSVYQRQDGRWEGSMTVDAFGRRRWFLGRTRQEAARKLGDALKQHNDGAPVPGGRQTVAEFLAGWLEGTRPSLRPGTWLRYEEYVRLHVVPALGKVPLARLTPQQLQRLYAERLATGLSPTTVHHLHATLHKALGQAARWGLVARNVADLVDPPRPDHHEMTTLSPEQVRELLAAAAGDRLEALYVVALEGLRRGEILALRWRDIDLDARTLRVRGSLQPTPDGLRIVEPKTASSRRGVVLSATAVEALRRHRVRQAAERLRLGPAWEDHDLVFANEVGRPIDGRNLVRRGFEPLLARAGLPRVRFHDLRHTAATLLLGQGVHPKIVAEKLGHSQISTTIDLYSHVTPTMQREAAETLDAVLKG
jgi:integrase